MIQTTLRINTKLYQEIIKKAKKEKRSINKMIEFILEKYLEVNRFYY